MIFIHTNKITIYETSTLYNNYFNIMRHQFKCWCSVLNTKVIWESLKLPSALVSNQPSVSHHKSKAHACFFSSTLCHECTRLYIMLDEINHTARFSTCTATQFCRCASYPSLETTSPICIVYLCRTNLVTIL